MACKHIALAFAFGLSACGTGPKWLNVTGSQNAVTFSTVAKDGKQVCIEQLIVYPASPEDAPSSWHVLAIDLNRCSSRIVYGEEGDNFAEDAPARALQTTIIYRARATGGGFHVVRDFIVKPDGTVVQERLADDQ